MTELSSRWKALSKTDREPFFEMEGQDRQRFQRESAVADAEAFAEQNARRENLVAKDGEDASMRGERRKIQMGRQSTEDARKARKERIEADLDPEILEERKRVKEHKKAEAKERQRKREVEEKKLADRHKKLDKEASKKQDKRLEYLLQQSSIFGKLKSGRGSANEEEVKGKEEEEGYVPHHRDKKSKKKGERKTPVPEGEDEEEGEDAENHIFLTRQPKCIEFGTMKPYQVEGLNWMIHLAEKGLNGILADEMGLGKTLQSISILAYHYEVLNIQGPHLICVPKSTLSNWMNELNRWCPSLRAIKFHGTKDERADLVHNYFTNAAASHDGRRPGKQIMNEETGKMEDDNSDNPRAWDVCVTTYEVCNTEKQTFNKFGWKVNILKIVFRVLDKILGANDLVFIQ